MKLVYAILLLSSVSAFSETPRCVNIGTRSEGWLMSGQNLKKGRCANKIIVCGSNGSQAEGWYSAPITSSRFLDWDHCSKDESRKPKCTNIGTRNEGWLRPGGQFVPDKCSKKFVQCLAQGTESEGWYIVTAFMPRRSLVNVAQCKGEE